MANPFDAVGNFFSNVGKAVSEGISNLTGGSGNKSSNTPSSSSTNNSNNNNSKKAQNTPTPSSSSSTSKHSSSSSNTNNRSDSAGAQALTQQIASNSSTNTTTSSSKTGNSKIDSFVSTVKENISNSSDAPKTTVTEAMRDNTSSSNQPSSTTSQKTQNQTSSSVISSIIEDKPTQTVTEAIRENTSEKPSVGVGSTSKADDVVLDGFTGIVGGTANTGSGSFAESITEIFENKESSSKPSGGITPDDINYGVVNMGGLVGVNPSVSELNQPVPQTSDINTDTMVGLGEKPTLSLLPDDYNPLRVQSTISTLPDGSTWQIGVGDDGKATIKNLDKTVGVGTDLIYRDPSMVGIHTFDSKAEAEAFLEQLYPDGNYNWTDTSVPWYDTQTGAFIGYLGEEAYPYAIAVPETYDAPIRLEFNTGGTKGNSPATGTGKSSWTDVPSAKTRAELRDAGFDYGFSSRDLDYNELVTQNERRGYDESWYDGMVGQNTIPYDAEKGGYDARTSNISIADVKSGKVNYATLSGVQGGEDILKADATVIPTIDEKVAGYMGQEGLIAPAEQHIRAYFTIEDAVQRGVANQGGYWYESNPVLSGIFNTLDKAQEGVSQFSSDLKAGNIPFANVLIGATNPMLAGISYVADKVNPNDTVNPMIAGTTWGLGVVEGALGAPKAIASLDDNVKAARRELGDEALVGLAIPAALGMSNILANYYKDNPTDAFFDAATLVTGGAGIASRVASTASKLSKLDKPTYFTDDTGVKGIQFNDTIYGIDPKGSGTAKIIKDGQVAKEIRLPQTFIRDTTANIQDMVGGLKTRVENRKVMRDLGDSSQRSSKYSTAYFDDSRSPTIDGDFTFKDNGVTASVREKVNDKSNLNAFATRDIDNLIRNNRAKATGVTLFDDNRKGNSSLIFRDRDSTLPLLRDRDSTLPILRDKDSGNKALIVRDRDGALAVRSKDKQMPYVPKDRDVPPVHRKKDNKILPFLDELGDLFGGSGDGGLTGGTYGGRGRGRSWRVENEDIADASQFSGLF